MRGVVIASVLIVAGFFFASVYLIGNTPAPTLVRATPAQQLPPECISVRERPTGAELQAMTAGEAEALRLQREACEAAKKGSPPPSPRGLWYVHRESSPMTGQNNVTADLPAAQRVAIRSYKTTVPKLNIRCRENTTSAYIDFGALVTTDRTALRLRIDDAPPQRVVWRMSSNYEAAGLWRGGEAIPFIKSLLGKKTLLVEVTPHSESTVLVEFDLTGIDAAVQPVRETCGWR